MALMLVRRVRSFPQAPFVKHRPYAMRVIKPTAADSRTPFSSKAMVYTQATVLAIS